MPYEFFRRSLHPSRVSEPQQDIPSSNSPFPEAPAVTPAPSEDVHGWHGHSGHGDEVTELYNRDGHLLGYMQPDGHVALFSEAPNQEQHTSRFPSVTRLTCQRVNYFIR